MTKTSVTIEDSKVTVTGLVIANPEVTEYLRRYPDESRIDAFTRALEVGVAVLERHESSRNMDFLRQQADAIIAGVAGAVQGIPVKLETELVKKLGTEDGQALAPVATLVAQADRILREKVREVHTLLNDHIDPRRSDSTLGCALDRLRTLLDPKHDDSVQKAVDKSIQSVAAEQGAIASVVKKVVEETVKPLKATVDDLAKEVRGEEAVAEALQQTPAKGRPFEDELLPRVAAWAGMVGAQVEHVGPDNQPGDILVTLDSSGMASTDLCIIIEARDDQSARGRKRILDGMAEAMAGRGAQYGLYISRTGRGLANEIGDWSELQGIHGPVVACTEEHLRTALRFAIVDYALRQLKSAKPEIDATAIDAEVVRIRSTLGRIRTINTKANAVRSGADAISNEADDLKREITGSLSTIEELLKKGGGSSDLQAQVEAA